MVKNIQAIRGMNDILPDTSRYWVEIERVLRQITLQYGYQEIRLPLLEFTQLFARTIGEATDIVEKEMYTFLDRNGDSLTLRPEGTAGCIRAGIEHGLFYNKVQRLFYCGPMFRHERPQKGRYRQFHQFGVEAYGLAGPDIDAEMMLLAMRFWQELKIDHKVELQINTLGDADSRAKYREHLVKYFNDNQDMLDEDCKRRLLSNPLRILDSKNPALQDLIKSAPKIFDYLDSKAHAHFDGLCKILDQVKLPYVINPRLVRGLDYYCLTVFEWVTTDIGAQNTVCAGGHYDGLVAQMGGKATPAIGFALGLERLLLLVAENLTLPVLDTIYLVLLGDRAVTVGMGLAEKIRKNNNVGVIVNCGGGDLSAQLKRANKSEANMAAILGDAELDSEEILLKYLREDKPQQRIKIENIENFFITK
ncbi:MAG: histidine--tRNA ligase [Gammaproteobacteria bacterium]|nr:histidine--tRNA ligase [Gammaproteobacteria bacterium]